ncbi:uncharacterized protein ACHE_80646S [Aspergillus chevalieri]|uniref:RED-like N-terminal domain-containing protein n=1 Tax=Aspergillus chevalieri TaxID=182096 RepID=A0A7R7VXX2_ASPCH|nr:uncharacterized protein ACHE_80646S [Aspergillus chevalieri]BCR92746.1 hypothetical protein ACHE_80646S [Aspergillus chevalieri]
MNNEQFRRLIQDNNNPSSSPSSSSNQDGSTGNATPATALGSRMRSSIPMTPRSLTTPNFARQLADYRRENNTHQPPTKRFKSSAAPKGTKLPTGYQDRASLRQSQDDSAENIEKRIRALEEMVKEGKIDEATFEKLRAELGVGGDVGSTHMVKGLDWELLRRVRAGEDVSKGPEKAVEDEKEGEREEGDGAEEEEVDLEAEFERVTEEKGREDIAPVAPKEKEKKKGTMAPPPVPAQAQAQAQKKSRDEILRQLKASRAAPVAEPAPPPPESTLGSKFKKLGESRPEKKRWVETDENGRRREVLLITDAKGNTKRKTRWLDKPGESNGLLVPDKDAKPLGMEVPAEVASKTAAASTPVEDEDEDIFEGVGADYNPLADIGEDGSSSESDEEVQGAIKGPKKPTSAEGSAPPSTEPIRPSRPRNYFSTSTHDEPMEEEEDRARANPLTRDPTLLAALKRAAALRQASPTAGGDEEKDDSRSQRFLEEMRRREAQDAMDMDMGFGGSRIEDEEDEEFIGLEEGGRGGQKRKRGPKKRKGDKESASDVLGVLESRK